MTTRRTFTREFKVEAVKRITAQGLWVAEVARQLGVAETVLRKWKVAWRRRATTRCPATASGPPLEAELHRLRAENRRLAAERDILQKATAYFARGSL